MHYPRILKNQSSQEVGSNEFMEDLFRQYDRLIIFVISKHVADDRVVEDLTQNVLVKLYRVEKKLRKLTREQLTAYVTVAAQHEAASYNRILGKTVQLYASGLMSDSRFQLQTTLAAVEDTVVRKDTMELCSEILEDLPEHEKLLLYGKYIMKLSDEELAEQEGCKPDSIRMKLTRARRLAKKFLEEKGVTELL